MVFVDLQQHEKCHELLLFARKWSGKKKRYKNMGWQRTWLRL
jgi:hypothetical protein